MRTRMFEKGFTFFRKFSSIVFNKYLLALTIFLIWLTFFDKNALVTQWSLSQTIDQLEGEKQFILDEIERTKVIREDITTNQEKYAREKFYMKKPGEQVFIIE